MTVQNASSSQIECVWFIEQLLRRESSDQGAFEKVVVPEPAS
jgi:hypothetical protein